MTPPSDTVLFYSLYDQAEDWRAALIAELPDITFRVHPDKGDPDAVTVAMVWMPPKGFFTALPNLRLIVNLGSGKGYSIRELVETLHSFIDFNYVLGYLGMWKY